MTLDDINGKGDSYDLRGVIRRLRDQRGEKRQKGGTGVAGNGIVHVQSKELTLKHHLKLMAGKMVKFNVGGG